MSDWGSGNYPIQPCPKCKKRQVIHGLGVRMMVIQKAIQLVKDVKQSFNLNLFVFLVSIVHIL